ncbi:PREDICTED: synaptonemal complex central element protein 3 [Odobenus rosmarus divergens]|uniref:Synaptonemal complex central element protein 3 n=1 Tax=Odobenus rosmarus divergens TaxID=9708 RepID=A0A9B0H2X8_ODORO
MRRLCGLLRTTAVRAAPLGDLRFYCLQAGGAWGLFAAPGGPRIPTRAQAVPEVSEAGPATGSRPSLRALTPGVTMSSSCARRLTRATAPLCSLIRACLVVAVQATWMAYDMVVMRTNPSLAESMRRLEDAFLNCKEEMEKNWQELLNETKHKQ